MAAETEHAINATRSVRNYFYLDLTAKALQEAEDLSANPEFEAWGDIYYNRSLLATNPTQVATRISANASTALQAIKLLATFTTADEDNKELVVGTLEEWLAAPEVAADPTLQIVASQIYFELGRYKEALKLVSACDTLERMGMAIQIYLKMDCLQHAIKTARHMQDLDDDDVLTQLCTAWVNIAQGGEKVTEATFLLQELIEKFGPSVKVFNALAACQLHLKNYNSAFSFCKQARELARSSGQTVPADTLINSIVSLQHLRRSPDLIEKITKELRQRAPNHPWLQRQKQLSDMFDKYAANYK